MFITNGIIFKGTSYFFETLSVGVVPGTDLRFFDEHPFSCRKMHLYACASVDRSTLKKIYAGAGI